MLLPHRACPCTLGGATRPLAALQRAGRLTGGATATRRKLSELTLAHVGSVQQSAPAAASPATAPHAAATSPDFVLGSSETVWEQESITPILDLEAGLLKVGTAAPSASQWPAQKGPRKRLGRGGAPAHACMLLPPLVLHLPPLWLRARPVCDPLQLSPKENQTAQMNGSAGCKNDELFSLSSWRVCFMFFVGGC